MKIRDEFREKMHFASIGFSLRPIISVVRNINYIAMFL